MTRWPRSLFGRNALLIVALMVLAQLVSSLLVRQLVVKPRLEQIADAVARNVASIRAGLVALPPPERDAFVDAFGRRGAVVSGRSAVGATSGRECLSPLERMFVRSVSMRLAADATQVVWRRDADRSLSLRVSVGERSYWLALPGVLPAHEFTGAWFVASVTAALLALLGALAIQRRIDRPLRALVAAAETLRPRRASGTAGRRRAARDRHRQPQLQPARSATRRRRARADVDAGRHLARPAHAAHQAAPGRRDPRRQRRARVAREPDAQHRRDGRDRRPVPRLRARRRQRHADGSRPARRAGRRHRRLVCRSRSASRAGACRGTADGRCGQR